MKYTVEESKDCPGIYIAFAVNYAGDGEIYIVEFYGLHSKQLADEYAAWKNKSEAK